MIFRVVRESDGLDWPSGRTRQLASFDIEPVELESVVGTNLTTGNEEGLGRYRGIGLVLPTGRLISLVSQDDMPGPRCFILNADVRDNATDVISETMAVLGFQESQVSWVNETAQ